MQAIEQALRPLGLTARYRGLREACLAIALVMEDQSRLYAVIREVYLPVAHSRGCSWCAVERNLRTLVQRAWQVNPAHLSTMAGYPLDGPPSASQFIEIVASFLLRAGA